MVKMQTLSLFANRFQALGLMIGPDSHDQAGFDGAQHGDESLSDVIVLGGLFDPIFLAEGGAAQIAIRPLFIGGVLAGVVTDLLADLLGVPGKILEQDFGRAKITPHPLGGEERSERSPETEAIVAPQDGLDQRAEFMRKHGGNMAFRQSKCMHIPAYTQSNAMFPFSAKPQPKPGGAPNRATYMEARPQAVRFWLRLCRAKKYAG
jgi:hypothetical protein